MRSHTNISPRVLEFKLQNCISKTEKHRIEGLGNEMVTYRCTLVHAQ